MTFTTDDLFKLLGMIGSVGLFIWAMIRSLIVLYFRQKQKFDDERFSQLKEATEQLKKTITEVDLRSANAAERMGKTIEFAKSSLEERFEKIKEEQSRYMAEVMVLNQKIKSNAQNYDAVMGALRDFVKQTADRFEKTQTDIIELGKELIMLRQRKPTSGR